jgi:hypothetical protein
MIVGTPFHSRARSVVALAFALVFAAALQAPPSRTARAFAAAPSPSASPTPDARAEALFAKAKAAWRDRTEAKFATWAVLVRYRKGSKSWDNWWQASYRDTDQRLALHRIVIFDDEARRLKGLPINLFGVKIFDTNPDAEPLHVDDPYISPASPFGVVARRGDAMPALRKSDDNLLPPVREAGPRALPTPTPTPEPTAEAATPLPEIGRVEAYARDYRVELVGIEHLRYGDAYHLTLEPLRDPGANRLRDLWIATDTYQTVQLGMQGLFEGKPYDGARWIVTYVPLDGRWYVAQIRTDESMRFGLTTIDEFEFDFVDYHFPAEIPNYTFEKTF